LTALEDALTAEISALGQTDEVRRRKAAAADEIRMGLDDLTVRCCEDAAFETGG
jgi:phosphoenolpyruvate carboxylase